MLDRTKDTCGRVCRRHRVLRVESLGTCKGVLVVVRALVPLQNSAKTPAPTNKTRLMEKRIIIDDAHSIAMHYVAVDCDYFERCYDFD